MFHAETVDSHLNENAFNPFAFNTMPPFSTS